MRLQRENQSWWFRGRVCGEGDSAAGTRRDLGWVQPSVITEI